MQWTQLLLSSYGGNNTFTSLFKRDQHIQRCSKFIVSLDGLRQSSWYTPGDPTDVLLRRMSVSSYLVEMVQPSSDFFGVRSHTTPLLEGSDETQVMREGRSFKALLRRCLLGRKLADRLLFLASSCPVRVQCFHYERGSGISLNYFSKE